jgi:hypothetical protein
MKYQPQSRIKELRGKLHDNKYIYTPYCASVSYPPGHLTSGKRV